jgi:DNA-binding transcriptional LysR family regulator
MPSFSITITAAITAFMRAIGTSVRLKAMVASRAPFVNPSQDITAIPRTNGRAVLRTIELGGDMDRITGIQLFVRVVETGSFSKAGADLGITQPTATKHVAALEERLGARLFHRSTRGVTPTEVGALYYEKCKAIQRDLEEADNLAALLQSRVAGTLRISTSVAFGRRVLTPMVLRFMREHPELSVDLSFDDRYVNLVEQGIDLAIRMGPMADSSLGARYLGINPWVLVASPAYLQRAGTPDHPQDLSRHACLVYSSVQGDDRWHFTTPQGEGVSVSVKGPLRSNNLSALLAAARAGMGLAALPWYVAHESVADGVVQPLLQDHTLPSQEIHAVFPSPKLVPSKVNRFIAFAQQQFPERWWLGAAP